MITARLSCKERKETTKSAWFYILDGNSEYVAHMCNKQAFFGK